MSLGSIAHMQYYFARTGLLDGKGAQLAKGERKKSGGANKENVEPAGQKENVGSGEEMRLGSLSIQDSYSSYGGSDSGQDHELFVPGEEIWMDPIDPIMLPPTVSTYKLKPEYTEPVPDTPVLRRELKVALQDTCKILEESQKEETAPTEGVDHDGYYEIQGLHLLDITTLAIRAAKNYYTAHTNPSKLYAIKSEKDIRSDLYQVLDILKRMVSRNFRGGIRMAELTGIVTWVESVDHLIKREEALEQQEATQRESWTWREGDWRGREREREWLFLQSFDVDEPPLPPWPELRNEHNEHEITKSENDGSPEKSDDSQLPTDFLLALQDGQRLVKLHNSLVARSQRKFGEIKTWHSDVAKPYRMADNLRYWSKAAHLRWDIHLAVPALDVVNGKDEATWRSFEESIFKWARSVREELTEEWVQEAQTLDRRTSPPELKVEVPIVAAGAL